MKNLEKLYQSGYGLAIVLLVFALSLVAGTYLYRTMSGEEVRVRDVVMGMVDVVLVRPEWPAE